MKLYKNYNLTSHELKRECGGEVKKHDENLASRRGKLRVCMTHGCLLMSLIQNKAARTIILHSIITGNLQTQQQLHRCERDQGMLCLEHSLIDFTRAWKVIILKQEGIANNLFLARKL